MPPQILIKSFDGVNVQQAMQVTQQKLADLLIRALRIYKLSKRKDSKPRLPFGFSFCRHKPKGMYQENIFTAVRVGFMPQFVADSCIAAGIGMIYRKSNQ